MTSAIILAGAENDGPLQICSQERYEALIRINNIPMIEYVVNALKVSEHTGRILIIGPKKELSYLEEAGITVVQNGSSLFDNVALAMEKAAGEEKVLIATCDIPMITGEMVDAFFHYCSRFEADFYYPIIRKEDNERYYPNVKRTYVQMGEGTFTGGNFIMIKPEIFPKSKEFIRKALENRKKPWKMCQLFGWLFVFKLLCKALTIPEAEKRLEKVTGIKGKAIIFPYPEVGIDVDKVSDFTLANEYFLSL